jgi:predicted permease
MQTLWQDLRYAARTLSKDRAFTIVAVVSLAFGIGANATIFSAINGLLLRPPAINDAGRLLQIWQHNTTRGGGIGSHMQLSFPDYEYYRDHNQVFTEMAAFSGETSRVIWNRSGQGEVLQGAQVSANFFSILDVTPVLGRRFVPDDDRPSTGAAVVMLSNAVWQQRLGADPAILGKTLILNGREFTVVGIAPRGFTGLLAGFAPDFWTPMAMHSALSPALNLAERHQHWIIGLGQLKPGTTPARARADLAVLGQQLSSTYDADRNLAPAALPLELVPTFMRGFLGGVSGVLMAVVGLVLLIACANLANLLLAKATSRRRELAIRAALGASRGRLIRQTLTESVLMAGLAGLLGLMMSWWATPALLSLKPASVPLVLNVTPDLRVLAFTIVISLLTGIAFGIAPALHQSRLDQTEALKDGSYHGGSARSRLRSGLVVVEVTACMVLLAGAALCVRSLVNARSIDPGFDPHHGLSASLNVETFGYTEERGKAYYASLLERVRALPGVRAASLIDHLPLGPVMRTEAIEIDGYRSPQGASGEPRLALDMALIAPNYFEAMGTPLLRGRGFDARDDRTAPTVVIINQAMADRFWPQQDPVGRYVTLFGPGQARTRARIVGVAKTGKYQSLGEEDKPFFYRSLLQDYQPGVQLIVRTDADAPILGALRDLVQKLDPQMPLVGVETLEQHMQLPLFPAQAAGLLLGLFGLLALALALMGVYGVMAFAVSQRTREIGVRMALGARRADVMRLVLGHAMRLTLTGIAAGMVIGLGVTRVLSSVLYGISASDPVAFMTVGVALTLVALIASYIPARWAAAVDPMRALRAE